MEEINLLYCGCGNESSLKSTTGRYPPYLTFSSLVSPISGTRRKRSQSESETSCLTDEDEMKRSRLGSRTPNEDCDSVIPTDSIHTLGFFDSYHVQEQQDKEKSAPMDQLQPIRSSSRTTDENEEVVITTIRATGVTLGLRRFPANFYVAVHHSSLEWRTENKCSSVDDDVVEWSGPIPLPLDLSTTVILEVYATFEFQPTLGTGEQLRRLTITLFPQDGDVVSACSSILIIVKRRNGGRSAPRVLSPHCSSIGSQGELEEATNHGHIALSRYRKRSERQDLEHAIQSFERALKECPAGHPCRAVAQTNLATAKFILCHVERADVSLEDSLQLYRSALTSRPAGHPDRPYTLIQLAAVHFMRSRERRDHSEGAQTEALLHEAAELSSRDSHESRAATFMLQLHVACGVSPVPHEGQFVGPPASTALTVNENPVDLSAQLLEQFERFGDPAILERAIRILEELVRSAPVRDERYLAGLANLSMALSRRFEHLGQLSDLESAISRQKDVIGLTPNGHPQKPMLHNNLGNSLLTRFERLGQLWDLEDAISSLRIAIELTPRGHPHKPDRLNNLGNSLKTRFLRLGKLSDLDDAISSQRDAVDLTPHGHPHLSGLLNNLGNSLTTRFERRGELSDLEEAISRQRDAVSLTPDGHPHKPTLLINLGKSFLARFERLGQLRDLQDAITKEKHAINLTPHGHPQKSDLLNHLGNSFFQRFLRLGELGDLEDAISRQTDAINLIPHGHPNSARLHNDLGNTLKIRFLHLGQLGDLEFAIVSHRNAIDLIPHDHPEKPTLLNNLGNCLRICFECRGKLGDLEDALSRQKDAVNLTSDGHPNKPRLLNDLGNSFRIRFLRLGELSDIEDAISKQGDAVDLTPHGHPDMPMNMSALGNSLVARFLRFGELSDLEDAISRQKDAVDLIPEGHPQKPALLNDLGTSMNTRFERLGQPADLTAAISSLRDAVDLTPNGDPRKPYYLNNLGNSVRTRFLRLQHISDIEDAISRQKDAVNLTPDDNAQKPALFHNLGNSFLTRFLSLQQLTDLEEAMSMHKEAVNHTPDSSPHKPTYLNSLSTSLKTCFLCLGELSDLKYAISRQKDALNLTPHGHPNKLRLLNNLANSFETCFERFGDPSNLDHAISLYSHAASSPIGPTNDRFLASQNWISCARRAHHHSLLHAYSVAVGLLPQLAWIGLSLTHRYDELTRAADVVREAAATALEAGLPETAVEWLEQGRSIVWEELFQLRSSYDELSSIHPDLAQKLGELSVALHHAGAAHEKSLSTVSERLQRAASELFGALEHAGVTDEQSLSTLLQHTESAALLAAGSLQPEADKQRGLAIERDKLLQEIRGLPGFEGFLLHKEFSRLRVSAHSGPVVILNAAESRCDALIVLADVDHVIHVPLPNFGMKRCSDLQNTLKTFVREARDGKPEPWDCASWEHILSPLWRCVVRPVLDALAFSTPGDLSRIFWCPTGPFVFLPIHAAGFYDEQYSQPGHKVFDFAISSFVPTLSILTPSLSPPTVRSGDIRFLVVPQPPSDGLQRLPGVVIEVARLKDVITTSPCTTLVESSACTVEEVLDLLTRSDWCHFACHGIQDGVDSGLCLANECRLKLRDIIAVSRPRGGLAFLSACQTATGEKRLSDEAIHIAAGMLFAGFEGVIGTMWSISDRLAPEVARDVYGHLFRNGTRPDHRDAARALHEAIGWVRDTGRASFVEWVPFIHVDL